MTFFDDNQSMSKKIKRAETCTKQTLIGWHIIERVSWIVRSYQYSILWYVCIYVVDGKQSSIRLGVLGLIYTRLYM